GGGRRRRFGSSIGQATPGEQGDKDGQQANTPSNDASSAPHVPTPFAAILRTLRGKVNLVNPRPHRVSTSLNGYKQCKAGRGALTPLHSQVQPEAGPSRSIPQVVTTSDLESDKEKLICRQSRTKRFPGVFPSKCSSRDV